MLHQNTLIHMSMNDKVNACDIHLFMWSSIAHTHTHTHTHTQTHQLLVSVSQQISSKFNFILDCFLAYAYIALNVNSRNQFSYCLYNSMYFDDVVLQ